MLKEKFYNISEPFPLVPPGIIDYLAQLHSLGFLPGKIFPRKCFVKIVNFRFFSLKYNKIFCLDPNHFK